MFSQVRRLAFTYDDRQSLCQARLDLLIKDFNFINYEKNITIVLSGFLIFAIIRLLFFYSLFDLPYMFGTKTYIGGSKYDFPICLMNPLKTKSIKEIILNSAEQSLKENLPFTEEEIQSIKHAVNYKQSYDEKKYYEICHYEDIKYFFLDSLDRIQDFNVVSVATSTEEVSTNKNVNSFLLEQKAFPQKKCVAIIDKKSNQILRFGF